MYSTNIKNNRSSVECLIVSRNKYVTEEKFIIDTGAKYTCCSYTVVDHTLEEKMLKDSAEVKIIGGIVQGTYLKFYKYYVKQFTIGSIDLGSQEIWITFDERITYVILGMDILRQVIMILNSYNQQIYFCKDAEDYNQNFVLDRLKENKIERK